MTRWSALRALPVLAGILQQRHDIVLGNVDRQLAAVVLHVDVGARVQQHLCGFLLAPVGGRVQRRPAVHVLPVDVAPALEQQLQHADVALGGGDMYRGGARLRVRLITVRAVRAEPLGRVAQHDALLRLARLLAVDALLVQVVLDQVLHRVRVGEIDRQLAIAVDRRQVGTVLYQIACYT